MSNYQIDMFLNIIAGGFLGGAAVACAILIHYKWLFQKYFHAKKDIELLIIVKQLEKEIEELAQKIDEKS